MATLILLPHRDIHLALNNADANTVEFSLNRYTGANGPFTLNDVTSNARTSFKMIAPHNAVGDRLEQFVTIDLAAGTISADAVGTNLVVFEFADQGDPTTVSYLTARIQVHEDILAWWFGNEKITTALDGVAHSQPSIYARFSDDDTGTDRTGDITGHGFVTLNSLAPARFSVDAVGRLQGISETPANDDAELEGSFLGVDRKINVKVVDYAKNRDIMVEVRAGDLATAAKRPNILFLAEGFTAAEEENFDKIVTHVADELFSKRRHEPFGTLKDSFNIFKAFTPSDDRLITCGFQVTDSKVSGLDKGSPIPFEHRVSVKGIFEIGELVAKVGLPKRGENRGRGALVTLWKSQGIDFDDDDTARIDDKLVEAWKNSHSGGFLEARDTFFGMMIGARWGDRDSEADEPALATPPDDDDSDALKALVQRAYEFYKKPAVARSIGFDPRRHPPTLYLRSNESRTTSFIRFLEGLRMKKAPNQALGSLWVPDGTFKPSRGLIAMIVNEQMDGGTSIGSGTLTANNLRSDISLKAEFEANANADIKVLRRVVPNKIRENLAETINTIAHEFGHSFKLGDEYEEFIRDKPDRNDDQDNIASMETIFADADFTKREIDPNKVKWRLLPRITLSAKLSAATQVANGKIEATKVKHRRGRRHAPIVKRPNYGGSSSKPMAGSCRFQQPTPITSLI